jgi:hypothetical protein
MKCEYCNLEHDGQYGSGRFCSNKCARGFSTKYKRAEINVKVSLKLGNGLTKQQRKEKNKIKRHASYIRETELKSILDVSSRTSIKILKRMNLPCSCCGWFVKDVVCDLHHIVPKKQGGTDDNSNLAYICPNCHRLVHSNKIDSTSLISLDEHIGDRWKEYYYVKNGKIYDK